MVKFQSCLVKLFWSIRQMETYFSVCAGAESTMYAQSTAGQEQKFKQTKNWPKCYSLSEQIIGIIINS